MSQGSSVGPRQLQEDIFHQKPGDRHIVLHLTFNSGHEAGCTSLFSQRISGEHAHPDTPPKV